MKKLLLLVLIGLVLFGFYTWNKNSNAGKVEANPQGETNSKPDPLSASFIIDGNTVTLSNGRFEEEDESGLISETFLLEQRAYGDLNDDGKNDTLVFIARSGGGSGTFIYVAGYVSGPVTYKGTNAVFLGDRISPQTLNISQKVGKATYLDRKSDEPFAVEPTIPSSKEFVYRNGELVGR